MTYVPPFTIDIRGLFSWRQAAKVVEALQDEARSRGLELRPIDVTTHNSGKQALIAVFCAEHRQCIAPDSACEVCMLLEER